MVGAYYGLTSPLNLGHAIAGQGAFQLLLTGTGFTSSSVAQWNGQALATIFGDATDLAASVPAALIAAPGAATITVRDSSSGLISNTLSFAIASPAELTAGVVQLISIAPDGSPADDNSLVAPSINGDGRYVAFQSKATNLVPGPSSGFQDIYLRDTCLGSAPPGCRPVTTRVSVTYDGSPANGHNLLSSISADGRFIAFESEATNILAGTSVCQGPAVCDFLRDTCNGAAAGCVPGTSLISVDSSGNAAIGEAPEISSGGRFVVFDSGATNIVSGDANGWVDVFERDTCYGAPSGCTPASALVSVSTAGTQGNSLSDYESTDAIGRFVIFESYSTNLVPNEKTVPGVFLRDTCSDAPAPCSPSTMRLDLATDGTQANNQAFPSTPVLSADGRLAIFASHATNLVPADVGGWGNAYERDTCLGASAPCTPTTTLASLANDGSVGNCPSPSQGMAISANGRFVAFDSIATNLVPGDTFPACGWEDIFIRDTCFGASAPCVPSTVRASVTNTPVLATQSNASAGHPALSGDGRYVVFLSPATNLVPGMTGNGHQMVYLAKTGF